jgi:hypothetical protein
VKPLRFSRSSRKHRIGKASARHVIATAMPHTSTDANGVVSRSWVGDDERGRELEILAFEQPDCWLVVHVMPTHYRRNKP